ncbi:MAG: hypothetical protein ACR2HH_12330 [Chthoniobacterales bacterium]
MQNRRERGTLVGNCLPSRWRGTRRRLAAFAVSAACVAQASLVQAAGVRLSAAEAARIGKKVWQNECAGTVAGLTSWNAGENFASLGIGHFIWYPKGARGPFEESFPDLLEFMAQRGAHLPAIVADQRACPWNSRAEFLAASQKPPMKGLRQFLAATVNLQAEFLVARLEKALPKMLAAAPAAERARIASQFDRVASTPQGCYALVDYVNFKGEGLLDSERYAGQGWGLLQVLEGMNGTETGPAAAVEFSRSARAVLTRRVKNSPSARNESRWLPGWLQRVQSYAKS